jgi:N-acetylneuraminic acid mutarotase
MLTNISSFGHLVIGNLLFVVGGMNYDTQQRRNSEIISINLDSGSIKKYESKTSVASIPSPRINPCVSAIEKSILLVFGGEVYNNNTGTSSFLNDMYIFKIETKTWTKIEDSFHSKFPLLVRPSLINFGDNCLYLLGGKRQILHNDGSGVQEIDNFGMYKLRVINKTINSKSDCCVK